MREHLLVAERALGRPVPKKHAVHHINNDGLDNSPGNLVLCESHAYHMLLHQRARALAATGNANALICLWCGDYGDPCDMSIRKNRSGGLHRRCMAQRGRHQRARRKEMAAAGAEAA